MKKRLFTTTIAVLFSAFALIAIVAAYTSFTPDRTFTDGSGDVDVPNQCKPGGTPGGTGLTGWDLDEVATAYDRTTDKLYVGISAYNAIVGDADGDGDPGGTSACLASLSGQDYADFGSAESVDFIIDADANGTFETIVGMPMGQDITGLGVYQYTSPNPPYALPGLDYGSAIAGASVSLTNNPSASNPDYEIAIENFAALLGKTTSDTLEFCAVARAGSLGTDAGFGEDLAPSSSCFLITYTAPASIGDYVWNDTDVNGIQDAGELGVSGVTVELWLPGGGSPIATTTTDGSGNYEFPGLPAGDYIVEFVAPANYGFSPKDAGTDDTKDSDADLITGRTDIVTVAPGDVNPDVDAGLYDTTGKVVIGNIVWADNGTIGPNNGQKDNDEAGIDGVVVELYRDDGNGICEPGGADNPVLATATTAGGGIYQFLNLTPSTAGVLNTFYCVAISKDDSALATYGFLSSSTGGAHDPNSGDHNIPNGDDGVPNGVPKPNGHVITQPLAATLGGQGTFQSGEPSGYGDNSTYMTVDFGFLTNDPTAVNLKTFGATNGSLLLGLLAMAGLMLAGTAVFVWQKRQRI